jgi:hypothetical protein
MELTEAGRLQLATLIAEERQTPIREPLIARSQDLGYLCGKVLANEEKRLRESGQNRRRA